VGLVATFTLDGVTHEYLQPAPGSPENAHSWEYGHYPKVSASVPLAAGGSFDVFAHAERWNSDHVLVRWEDDDRRPHSAWIPAANVRRVTDSAWDIWEYHRCPERLRRIRWGATMPGFIPS